MLPLDIHREKRGPRLPARAKAAVPGLSAMQEESVVGNYAKEALMEITGPRRRHRLVRRPRLPAVCATIAGRNARSAWPP